MLIINVFSRNFATKAIEPGVLGLGWFLGQLHRVPDVGILRWLQKEIPFGPLQLSHEAPIASLHDWLLHKRVRERHSFEEQGRA